MMGESTSDLKLRQPELRRETESPLRFSESVFLQSGQTAVASNTGGPHQPVSLCQRVEKDASGKVGCHTRTGNTPLCQSCTLLLLLCLSHLYHTGFGIIRMLSRGLICPWCEGTEEERLAATRAGTLFSQGLLGIYVPLCFPTSFPFCNRSVQDYISSSLHHSPPCTGIRECARGGESLLACLSLLSLSTLAVERETPSGFSFKIDPHERLSCRLRPCIPPPPSLSPSFSFPFFLKKQTVRIQGAL